MDKTARLIGEVAARYGIRLDPDDPAFALVALNQLVLEDAVQQIAGRLQGIVTELESAAENIGLRAGAAVAEQIRKGAPTLASARAADDGNNNEQHVHGMWRPLNSTWMAIGVTGGLLLFGLGLLVGARVL